MARRAALERRRDSYGWAPIVTRLDLPGDAPGGQYRYLEAAVNGVLLASIYAPNRNRQPGPKFDYKLAWLTRLSSHAAELYATGAPVVLAGDYNVAPTDLDIYPTKSWDRDALLQPWSRAAYQRLLSQGWTDAIRALRPKNRCTRFGITCGSVGNAMAVCVSTTERARASL
jgi:exodeoxyribonuclease-3